MLMFHLGQLRLLRSVHDFMSYFRFELLSHIIVKHVYMFGCKIDLLSLIRCMHPFISGFEIEVIRLIRTFAWFHATLWNCADQIDQDTENISNFVDNQSLCSNNSGIHLIMFGFQNKQVRLIRDVSHQVRLWIWTTQTYQTYAWFLTWLWNWADQTNQRKEFWNFIF